VPLLEIAILRRAVANIANWGDTDVFPLPIENHVFRDSPDPIVDLLSEMAVKFDSAIDTLAIDSYSTLAPVGYTGFRWATQIEPIWNAYLLACVLSLAPDIERARLSEGEAKVFSYRYRQQTSDDSLFALDSWNQFQETTRRLAENHEWVVSVDIGDFYARVYHHRLENSLQLVDNSATKTKHIMAILKRLSNNTSYGLPVGGPAARILAELVLNRVDHLIIAEPTTSTFCRYADDYRFFVNDVQAAYKCVGLLSEKLLRNEGLTLQKSKTRIMKSSEYLSVLDPPNPPRGSAGAFLNLNIHYDPYSPTASEDYDRLKHELDEFDILSLLRDELVKGRIHSALARRLIQALRYMEATPRQQAVLSLLENIETLAPVIPQVMMAIRECISDLDPEFVGTVHAAIRKLIRDGHYVAQVDLNLAFMIRVLAGQHSTENELLLIQLYQSAHGFGSGPAPNVQRDIMLILARWGVTYWLSDQKNYVASAHPWVKRAFIIASYELGDEGRYWRSANMSLMGSFDRIVRDWTTNRRQRDGSWQVPV
jgi:Reverse transcriptase (RNA-dependent DNA polymerase)